MMGQVLRQMGLLLLCLFLLGGCWDYRGLNEQTIVAGMAVDLGEEEQGFSLTFEIMDLEGEGEGQFASLLLTTEGESLGEALFDAYAKLHDNVYLGAADVVLVSQTLAEQRGIMSLVDYLVRNPKAQNNRNIVIAAGDSAAELLSPAEEEEGEGRILSAALGESLRGRRRGTRKEADALRCYEIFNRLAEGTSSLALPLVGSGETEDIPFQLEGLALFSGDRMTGKLDKADMPLYLLAAAGLRDRAFSVDIRGPEGKEEKVVLANRRSRPRLSFQEADNTLRFVLDISMTADAAQLPLHWGPVDQAMLRRIEAGASETLENQVSELIVRHQKEGHDILGFGETLRKTSPRLWEALAGDWDWWFKQSEVDIRVDVQIQNAGILVRTSGGMQG